VNGLVVKFRCDRLLCCNWQPHAPILYQNFSNMVHCNKLRLKTTTIKPLFNKKMLQNNNVVAIELPSTPIAVIILLKINH